MNWLIELVRGTSPAQAVAQAVLLIGIVAACGIALGSIRVRGISLGIGGVLFAGLILGHLLGKRGIHIDERILNFARDFGLILFVYAIAIGAARGEPLSFQAIVRTGGVHLGGSVLVGFAIGLVSGSTAAALRRASRATAMGAVVGLVLLLAAGLSAIAHATRLERSARPPFIMFGLPAVAIALAVAAPAFTALISAPDPLRRHC